MSLHALSRRFLVGAGLLAASAGALAAEQVGRVLLAAGDTFAVRDGQAVRLAFNSPIEFKDVLRTGPASSLQIRFVDDSLLSVREGSEFAIEEYQFGNKPEEQRSFFRLVKGGFRAVTGLIGRTNHANYRVTSQTATIGIRGTDYAVRDCQGDCGPGVKNGLYGTVLGLSNGTNQITVTNKGGEGVFSTNQSFYVPDANTRPQPLLVPPSFVSVKPQGKASASQQGGSGTGGEKASDNSGASAESRPSGTPTITGFTPVYTQPYQATETLNVGGTPAVLPPPNGFVIAFPGMLVSGSSIPFSGLAGFDDKFFTGTINGQNQLLSFMPNGTGGNSLGTLSGSLAGGSITDSGSVTLSNGQVFAWGRWTGPDVVTSFGIDANSNLITTTLTNVPLLFGTASGVQNGEIVGTIGGTATYNFAGGPRPVDFGGNVGSVTSSNLAINFTQETASYSLGMSFPSIIVSGSNTGSAAFSLSGTGQHFQTGTGEFEGTLSGSCSGAGCNTTSSFGFFSVGLTGPNGYDVAVVTGLADQATKAGDVAFLNAYSLNTFTPGAAPTGSTGPSSSFTGQIVYANQSPSALGTNSLATSTTTFNSSNQPTAFGGSPSGNLGTGTIVEVGATTLVDGGTMNWGRWSGGQVTDSVAGLITPGTGVSFVVGNANTTIPSSGSFVYSLAGGPNAMTSTGVGGSPLSQGAFNISFSPSNITMSVATPLMFTIPSQGTYSLNSFSSVDSFACASGVCSSLPVGIIHNMNFNASCTSGTCLSVGSANATGILVGPQAAGYGVAGSVSSSSGAGTLPVVTFAGAFKR